MTIGNRTTSNDITGDPIQSKQLSKQGRNNFDNIDWGARARDAKFKESQDYSNEILQKICDDNPQA